MMSPDIVERSSDPSVEADVNAAYAIFVVDDNACTRCSVCVERCPADVLYYARLPEGERGARTMAAVPMSQQTDEDAG
jgi:ferredoxin